MPRCTGSRTLAEFFPYGWQHYLIGGLLLGLGMSVLFVATGLFGGMSTVFTTPIVIALAAMIVGAYVQGRYFAGKT